MKNINELIRETNPPLWQVNISPDPITKLNRLLEADALYIANWGITLRGFIYFLDAEGNKITDQVRLKPYSFQLVAGTNNDNLVLIDPATGDRVYPDENGEVPDESILRYDALMSKLNQLVNINEEVINFIHSADLNQEFDF